MENTFLEYIQGKDEKKNKTHKHASMQKQDAKTSLSPE